MAAEKLPPNEVSAIEARIRSGDTSDIRAYVVDSLDHHIFDRDELVRRKMFLGEFCVEDFSGAHGIAMLSVLTGDAEGWTVGCKLLGDRVAPDLGFNAYRYLQRQLHGARPGKEWDHLLMFSAKRGHIQSRNLLFDRRCSGLGPLKWPMIVAQRFFMGVVFLAIFIRDSTDRRLPTVPKR